MSDTGTNYTEQRARLELLGGVGAAILGAGVALIFRQALAPLAVPLVLVGLGAHGLGMWGKHRLDAAGFAAMPRWSFWAFWGCWVLIAGIVIYLASGLW